MENDYFFLRNIRQALGVASDNRRTRNDFPTLFASPNVNPLLDCLKSRSTEEREELVETLRVSAAALGIHLHCPLTDADATSIVVEIIRSREPEFTHVKHVILHDHPDVAALQLWKRFSREAVTVHTAFGSDRDLREKTIASFVGITAPAIGVAESATVIQLTRPGQPRSTSLVPSIHIALLRQDRLVANLAEAYALLEKEGRLDSLVFVSGPSKTADIEAQMVHGAHGPREMHLVVLPAACGLPAVAGD